MGGSVNKNNLQARPGFEKHPPLDFSAYKKEMLEKRTADTLPDVKVFDPKASKV